MPFFLITFYEPDTDTTLPVCGRGILQTVTERLAAEGLEAYAGAEVSTIRAHCHLTRTFVFADVKLLLPV